MVMCAVFGCNSNNNKKLKNAANKNISFYTFPKNDNLCEEWIKKCSRPDKFTAKNARICSRHFNDNDFERNLKHELLNITHIRKKLKDGAIPTVNLQNNNLPKSLKNSKHRGKGKACLENKLIVKKLITSNDDVISTENDSDVVPWKFLNISIDGERKDKEKINLVNENKEDEIENIRKENDKLKIKNDTLQSQIREMKATETSFHLFEKSLQKIFTPSQIRKIKDPHRKIVHWKEKDMARAIALHAAGPKAYRWMHDNHHPLPGESTLRRWANKIDISPGILGFVFRLMEAHSLPELDKVCVIMTDAMKVKISYEYDQNTDTLMKPANNVRVIMARGLFCNWKQPLFYEFDQNLNKPLLFGIIKKLKNIGFNVVAINNDSGSGSRGLWKLLGITEQAPFFLNPVNMSEKIYVFADVPHLVKLIRNHFLDSEFFIHSKKITKSPVLELFENSNEKDLNIAHKLTTQHLNAKNAATQKLKLATQLFSHTNSKAISRMGMLGLLKSENWQECANFLTKVNDWFDVFNSRLAEKDSRIKAYGFAKETQDKIIAEMKNIILNLRVGKSKCILPFQKGILISSNALPMLFDDLVKKYKSKYLLTYRLNQDPLKVFFGNIRSIDGLHDHPTTLEFKFQLKNYLFRRNETSQSINMQSDNESNALKDLPIIITSSLLDHIIEATDDVTDFKNTFSELEYDGIDNIAGFIAYKLRDKENLGTPTNKEFGSSYSWTNNLSEGELYKPNDDFLHNIYKLEEVFSNYNGVELKCGPNYIKTLIQNSTHVNCSLDVKNLYFRCKLFFRIRILNQKIK